VTLETRTARGIALSYSAYIADKLSMFLSTIVLAHVLAPNAFGIFASVMLFVIFVDNFRDFGLADALVYFDDADGLFADTTFWFVLIASAIITAGTFAAAPLLSHLFYDNGYTELLRAVSIWFLLSGLGLTHEAILGKRLAFVNRYAIDITVTIVKTMLLLGLAFAGFGIWSLIGGLIGGAATRTIMRWFCTPWSPRLRFSFGRWLELFQYGRHILAVKLNDYVVEKVDQLTIVWLLGAGQLGFYYMALRFPELLLYQFNVVLTRVMYPVFASLRSDREACVRFLLAASRYTALVVVPIGLGLALTADVIVKVLLGDEWAPAAAPLVTLSLAGMMQSLLWSSGDMFRAVGRPDLTTRIAIIELCLAVPSVIFLVSATHQLWVAGLALLLVAAISNIIRMHYARAVLGVPMRDYFAVFISAATAGGGMVAAVALTRLLVHDSSLGTLLLSIAVGFTSYLSILIVIDRAGVSDALALLRSALAGR
jgi:O-antigen/teichoic acid export membrane protein